MKIERETAVRQIIAAVAALALPAMGVHAAPSKAQPRARQAAEYVYLKDGTRVPLFAASSAETPVARVGGEAVELRKLVDALAAAHGSLGGTTAAGKRDPRALLDRLVDVELVLLEARTMGLQDLPEYRAALTSYRESALRLALQRKVRSGVKVPRAAVEQRYRDSVREWNVQGLLFAKEEDARRLAEQAAGVGRFDALAAEAIASGKATGADKPEALPEAKMIPAVVQAVRQLQAGGVTPPIVVPGGFTVVHLVGQRYPDDPARRAQAEEAVRGAAEDVALQKYYARLVEKYARIDTKLLDSLDLDAATPGLEALAKDRRPVVRIRGDKPVTVADLVEEMRRKLYHGAEETAGRKKLNARKPRILDGILASRLPLLEARRQKLQETRAYRWQVEDFAERSLFSLFVEKAIAPSVQVTAKESRAYYDDHRSEYTRPEFLKLESLGFDTAPRAVKACEKLRGGTDFRWLAANAEGQLPAERLKAAFDGHTYASAEFPPSLVQALAGAQAGECRLYADAEGGHYAIRVVERPPVQVQSFEEARGAIERILSAQKLNDALRDVTAKLRQSYPVEELIVRIGA